MLSYGHEAPMETHCRPKVEEGKGPHRIVFQMDCTAQQDLWGPGSVRGKCQTFGMWDTCNKQCFASVGEGVTIFSTPHI